MKILTIMYVKSSINKVSSIRVLFFIYLIFTKIECWPIFKQDPTTMHPRCRIKEVRFNDANLSKQKCAYRIYR